MTVLVGMKCGMTRIFRDSGESIPVTVVEVLPNRVVQLKTVEVDGYAALQVTMGTKSPNKLTNAEKGHYAKAKVEPGLGLFEIRLDEAVNANLKDFKVGDVLNVGLFTEGQVVDVIGTSKGKGYAGTVKRHNFRTQDATHGNSLSHRAPGSIGQRQTPGRVYKNKRMAGHLGNERCTILNLKIAKIEAEKNLLFVEGAVPGAVSSVVFVRSAVKDN